MCFFGHAAGRWFGLALTVLAGTSCSSPAFRDFSTATARTSAVQRAGVIPALIDAPGEAPVDLGSWLAPIRERAHIPAIAASVLRGNQIVAQGVAGVRRRGSNAAVTLDDRFQIASCAKAMSATLVARLVEEGLLTWDQPVARYFPREALHPAWDKVTLRHLLTHTAGLRDPWVTFLRSTAVDRGTLAERRLAFVRRVLRSPPPSAPGIQSAYCNADYILAAAVAEKATGKSWEQLMQTHVFASLGLESAGFGPPGAPHETLQPWGHGKYRLLQLGIFGNAAFDPGSRAADYPAIASPAGYVHLSLRDWATFVSLHLRAHPANPHRHAALLRTESFTPLHEALPGMGYAGGWFVGTRPWAKGSRPGDTGRVLFHLGDNGRWTSAAWVAPEIDFAVLVTCNRGDMAAAVDEAVGRLVATYARPKNPAAR